MMSGSVDYEAELVVVIGARAQRVGVEKAWDHVAGLTIGQDLSERVLQTKPPAPM
jgi:2,4-didehydro-3-deoxy-L-rhamnonate hydrolase